MMEDQYVLPVEYIPIHRKEKAIRPKMWDYIYHVNSDTFMGRPPGTLLFMGIESGSDGFNEYDVTYTLAYRYLPWNTRYLSDGKWADIKIYKSTRFGDLFNETERKCMMDLGPDTQITIIRVDVGLEGTIDHNNTNDVDDIQDAVNGAMCKLRAVGRVIVDIIQTENDKGWTFTIVHRAKEPASHDKQDTISRDIPKTARGYIDDRGIYWAFMQSAEAIIGYVNEGCKMTTDECGNEAGAETISLHIPGDAKGYVDSKGNYQAFSHDMKGGA